MADISRISIFHFMKDLEPLMVKVYRRSDMFAEAKELFESMKDSSKDIDDGSSLKLDAYTYASMLEASASAHQWEYFEYVCREMVLFGFRLDQNKHTRLLVAASGAGKTNTTHPDGLVDIDLLSTLLTESKGEQSDSIEEDDDPDSCVTDSSLDSLTDRIDRSSSQLPSASDILDIWKKDRIKDGIFPYEYINSSSQ